MWWIDFLIKHRCQMLKICSFKCCYVLRFCAASRRSRWDVVSELLLCFLTIQPKMHWKKEMFPLWPFNGAECNFSDMTKIKYPDSCLEYIWKWEECCWCLCTANVDSWCLFCVSAEAGGAGQEGFKHEGAAAERAPLPQTPPGAALRVGVRRADPHRQHGLHHLHRLGARYAVLRRCGQAFI